MLCKIQPSTHSVHPDFHDRLDPLPRIAPRFHGKVDDPESYLTAVRQYGSSTPHDKYGSSFIDLRAKFILFRRHKAAGTEHTSHFVCEWSEMIMIQIHNMQRLTVKVIDQTPIIKINSNPA